jgi:hypothetical protein
MINDGTGGVMARALRAFSDLLHRNQMMMTTITATAPKTVAMIIMVDLGRPVSAGVPVGPGGPWAPVDVWLGKFVEAAVVGFVEAAVVGFVEAAVVGVAAVLVPAVMRFKIAESVLSHATGTPSFHTIRVGVGWTVMKLNELGGVSVVPSSTHTLVRLVVTVLEHT